jgi:hypothetical protein
VSTEKVPDYLTDDGHAYIAKQQEAAMKEMAWAVEEPDDNVTELRPYDGETRGETWKPINLAPYLAGQVKRPEPTLGLCRSDGLQMLYPGKEHTVIGEMECGKSWFCLACVAAELNAGRHVVYVHFEESDPGDTVERLQALQVLDAAILELFRFVGPAEQVDPFALAVLLDPAPSLVILDGVNEAMSLHNQAIRDEDGAAAFRRRLVKPCTAVGAAVLSADHVVKDKEARGRNPLGSIHKGNGLTGALISLENKEPFGRGAKGRSSVFVTKDRPGFLRRHGRADRKLPGKTFMGSLVVDDTRTWVPFLDLAFLDPPEDDKPGTDSAGTRDEQDDELVLASVSQLVAGGHKATKNKVRATTSGLSNDRVDNSLTRLALDGRLTETAGPNRSRLFSVPGDQPSESGA